MHLAERMVPYHQPPHQIECLSCIALRGLGSFLSWSSLIPGARLCVKLARSQKQFSEIVKQKSGFSNINSSGWYSLSIVCGRGECDEIVFLNSWYNFCCYFIGLDHVRLCFWPIRKHRGEGKRTQVSPHWASILLPSLPADLENGTSPLWTLVLTPVEGRASSERYLTSSKILKDKVSP